MLIQPDNVFYGKTLRLQTGDASSTGKGNGPQLNFIKYNRIQWSAGIQNGDVNGSSFVFNYDSHEAQDGTPMLRIDPDGAIWTKQLGDLKTYIDQSGTRILSFATAGAFTWVCPAGVTRVKAIVTGAGGGGARSTASQSGASGGAGGTAIGWMAVTPGASYTIVVGAGGIGGHWGTGGNDNGSGGGSSAAFGLTGYGGGGTVDSVNNGFGGTASGGNINLRGGDGQDAHSGAVHYSTNGGASYWGGGASSSTADSSASVVPGTGGCSSYGGVARAGGAGAAGIVVLEY